MVTKRLLKNVIVTMVTIFISMACIQGAQAQQTGLDYQSLNLLPFTGNNQLVLGEFDHLGRAIPPAHIQLQDKDEPKQKREPRLKHNPVGGIIIRSLMETGKGLVVPQRAFDWLSV